MPTVLMVAEKPSLAESLAKILSNNQCRSRKTGSVPVHEFRGAFQGQQCMFKFTSVCGHVLGVDFPENYNNWERVDPLDLYTAPVINKKI